MNHDEYALALGKLWGNINSLEFLLRAILQNRQKLGHKYNLGKLKVGDLVPVDWVTRYAYFSDLVKGFNDIATPQHRIPLSLIETRNALAHGSMSSTKMSFPLRLVKFGREDKQANLGQIPVEIAVKMTAVWLKRKRKVFHAAMMKAGKYA